MMLRFLSHSLDMLVHLKRESGLSQSLVCREWRMSHMLYKQTNIVNISTKIWFFPMSCKSPCTRRKRNDAHVGNLDISQY